MATMRRLFPAFGVLILLGLLGSAPLQALRLNETDYGDLRSIAGRLGMDEKWIERGERMELSSEWTRMRFEADRREFTLNGYRIHLGFPVAAHKGRLFLAESDYRQHLQPILTPQVFGRPPELTHIFLDAGHGGDDPGAENTALGLREKSLVLDLSRRLARRLRAEGYRVTLSRDHDRFIALGDRPRLANEAGADLFLSIHFNASVKPDVAGLETFAFTPPHQPSTARKALHSSDRRTYPGNANDPWNTLLGYYLQTRLVDALKAPDRGLKRARFRVLRDLQMPGLLLEAGFISNDTEGRNIGSAAYRNRIVEAILAGLLTYERTAERLSIPQP